MRSNRRIQVLLALATLEGIASLPCSAQEGQPVRTKEAVVASQIYALELPVTGLAPEGVDGVRADLAALELKIHRCQPCKKEQDAPGTCPGCKGALEPVTRPLFTGVVPSAEESQITLTPDPSAVVRLSQLESTLAKRSVRLDEERFTLGGRAQLVVTCPPTEGKAVEQALKDAKLFAEVKVATEPTTGQLVLDVRAGPKPPSRADVLAALKGAKAQLADVVWRPAVARS